MSPVLREVTIKVGRKSYFLRTTLDDESLSGISELSGEITERLGGNKDQETLLLLSYLQTAWMLEKLGRKLEETLEVLGEEEEQ